MVYLSSDLPKQFDLSKTPAGQQIKMSYEQAILAKNKTYENFQTLLNINGLYGENKSRQLNQFVPVTSPIKNLSAEIVQGTKYGASTKLKFFTEQFTNNFLRRSTTTGAELSLMVDLYKDFLGRVTRKRVDNLELNTQIADLNQKINAHQFKLNIQKIYWSLVANNESIVITNELIRQAKKQYKITSKKFKNSISDKGLLARTKSLIASRQGSLNSLEYTRSNLLKSLRQLIPEISQKNIELSPYDINQIKGQVLECTGLINKYNQLPLENTLLDEVSNIQNNIYSNEKIIAKSHSTIDLKMNLSAQLNGRDFSYSNSIENLRNDPQPVGTVLFSLSIPLSGQQKETEKSLSTLAEIQQLTLPTINLSKIKSYDQEIKSSIKVLLSALENQKTNTENLKISIENSRQKFSQARITVEQLVQEEDNYFYSEISSIQTNLSIIHTLLDYFSIFTNTPCALNI